MTTTNTGSLHDGSDPSNTGPDTLSAHPDPTSGSIAYELELTRHAWVIDSVTLVDAAQPPAPGVRVVVANAGGALPHAARGAPQSDPIRPGRRPGIQDQSPDQTPPRVPR